ncbi:MAG: amidohydrolase family protein [Polymorphobacter sp.]
MMRFAALIGLLLASAAPAATIAITGGTVATAVGETLIPNGTVIVRDGRIVAVGAGLAVPAGATVIDATGKYVTPGIITAMSTLGITEVEAVRTTNDASARGTPFSAAIDVTPALNPRSPPIAINRLGGVTRAVVGPEIGGEIFAGQGAIISLADSGDTLMRPRAFQFVEMGEDGARAAGGSRPAAWLNLRNGFAEAQRYARNPAAFDSGRDKDSLIKRLDAAALVAVVEGRVPAVIHAERASDISAVLGLRSEFPQLRIILVGAREGWMVADKIAAAKVPVITLSLFDLPDSFETLASTRSNVGRLVAAGVTVGLGIFGGDSGAGAQPRNLPYYAGNAVAQAAVPGGVGLTRGQALAAITRAPAAIFGLNDLGTLEVGKRGDVVVWDGDPLELTSAPVAVLIDGVAQPMTSRQLQLRDRYRDLTPGQLPMQYNK